MAAFMFISQEAAEAHAAAMRLCLGGGGGAEVEAAFRRVLELEPRHPDAACNLGVVLTRSGRPAEGVDFLRRAIRVKPGHVEAQVSLADALTLLATGAVDQGRPRDAVAPAQAATEVWPAHAEAHFTLGVAHHLCGDFLRAVGLYRTALLLDQCGNTGGTDPLPDAQAAQAVDWEAPRLPPPAAHPRRLSPVLRARAWNNIGIALQAVQRLPEAEEALRTAIALQPGFVEARSNLGLALVDLGRLAEAEAAYRAALAICPEALQPMNNLGVLLREQGRVADAVDLYARCVRLRGAHERNPLHNLVYALNFCPDTPGPEVQRQHLEHARLLQRLVGEPYREWPWTAGRERDPGRLTVGFVSPDLYRHSVAYFLDAPVRCLDRARFRLVAFAADTKHDGVTDRLKRGFDAWHRIAGTPDAREVAELVRREQVDILVDLTGHTAKNRLDVFALRPAPVQATWIGYPNTTGLDTVQYRLCDGVTDPEGASEAHSETLLRLDPCFLCYTPLDGCDENGVVPLPALRPPPATEPRTLTVGSFNAMAKLSARTIRAWARVATAVPQCQVLVKSRVFACPRTVELTLDRFGAFGVGPHRVRLVPFTAGRAEHLREYDRLDLALDCFPYSGTTTTCEALLMGVPVVTLRGASHRQNVTSSLLLATGLPELVADDEDGFVRIATELLRDPDRLDGYRRTVRDRFLASPACDAERFGRTVGAAFERMWRETVGGGGPA